MNQFQSNYKEEINQQLKMNKERAPAYFQTIVTVGIQYKQVEIFLAEEDSIYNPGSRH